MENEQYLQPTDKKQQWMDKVNSLMDAVDSLPSGTTGGSSPSSIGDLSKLETTDKTNLVRAINSLKSSLTSLINNLSNEIAENETDDQTTKNLINSLSQSLSALTITVEELEEAIPDISPIISDITSLQSDVERVEGKADKNSTDLGLVHDKANSNETAISTLISDLNSLEGVVNQLGEALSGTQSTVVSQGTSISTNSSSIATLTSNLSQLSQSVSTLSSTVSGLVTSVQNNTTAIGNNAKLITDANTALAAQNTLLKDSTGVTKRLGRKYKQADTVDTMRLVDWATMVGTKTKDTEFVKRGSESIRITSSTAGEQPFIRSSRTLKLQGTTNVELVFYLHNDPADIDSVVLFLSNDSGFTNTLSVTFPQISLVQGWNRLNVPVNKMSVGGTGTVATDMIRTQIKLVPLAGKTGSMTIDSVAVDHKQQANILFTFDDQWDTQYSVAFSEMRMRGLKGSIGVNGSTVGTANFMTWAQLQEVYGYGWDMVNHTNTHINLGQSLKDTQKTDIDLGRKALLDNGMPRSADILFYPYGSYNSDTLTVLDELNIQYARTIREHMEYPEPIQPKTLKIKNLLPAVTAANAQALVDDAIANGGTIIFLAHRLGTEDASNMFWDITKFTTLLNYVKTKQISGEVKVLTMTEWISTFN